MAEPREPFTPRIIKSKVKFSGKKAILRVDTIELEDGKKVKRETVEHPGVAAVVPLDSDGCVIMVRQYRIAAGKVMLEIPAGVIDEGETPEQTAQREMSEEIGMRAGMLTKLASFYVSPGISTEVIHLFLAEDLTADPSNPDEDEDIELKKVPLSTAVLMAEKGDFEDGKTLVGILMAARFERLLR